MLGFVVAAAPRVAFVVVALTLHVNALMGVKIPYWTQNNVPSNIQWQWERWLREDLADGVTLKYLPWIWGSARGTGAEFADTVARTAKALGKQVGYQMATDETTTTGYENHLVCHVDFLLVLRSSAD